MNQALGIAGRNRDAGFVVGVQVVQIETDLVAFDSRHHAETYERFRVAAIIADAVKLGLANAPAASGQEFGRRRALASGPVAVAHKVFENLGFFATDFLNPRVFFLQVVFRLEISQKVDGFCSGGRFVHAVKTASHYKFNEIALASALQAAVAPVT